MQFFVNFVISFLRLVAGVGVLLFAAGIPAYFVEVDKEAIVSAGKKSPMPIDVARIYFDGAKLSTAMLIADASAESKELKSSIDSLYERHPNWKIAGGDEPFFDAFQSTLKSKGSQRTDGYSVYSILSLGENRKKLLDFLTHSRTGLVAKFIDLRKMTSVILPPVYTSAGAPLDSALLTSALLAQTGDFTPAFLKDVSYTMNLMKGDSASKERFEKYCVGLLTLMRDMDWTLLRSLFPHFNSLDEVYDFARVYKSAKTDGLRNVYVAGVLMCGNVKSTCDYLRSADENKWRDFAFAFLNGEGALKFLLKQNKPIHRTSWASKYIDALIEPIKEYLGTSAVAYPRGLLAFKVVLSIFGGYLFIRGLLRLFVINRDTPSWASPLALARGFFQGAIVSLVFFILVEPDAFKIKLEDTTPPPELKFSFEKIANTIQEETMKFETDTATLAAVGLFFVLQLMVYILGVIRIWSIRRTIAPAKLKLKLLENEDNLFDLGLYIGLGGTVVSLILLTMGVVTASLMAAYASTLFGILFTSMIKIVNVRRYKRQLLIEAEKDA